MPILRRTGVVDLGEDSHRLTASRRHAILEDDPAGDLWKPAGGHHDSLNIRVIDVELCVAKLPLPLVIRIVGRTDVDPDRVSPGVTAVATK